MSNPDEVSDPANAVARFTGSNGEEAWLDKDTDGTLTGWIRDGQDVYRYTDPDAWATDVDGAEMTRADKKKAKSDAADTAEPKGPDQKSPDGRERPSAGSARAPEPLDLFAPARGFPSQKKP